MNKKRNRNNNIVDIIKSRETKSMNSTVIRNSMPDKWLLNRIELDTELEFHEGCVNTLDWNESGNLLLSASDDTKIAIWDPFSKKKLRSMKTLHRGNIFTAKFVPKTSDTQVATGAGDAIVAVHDVNAEEILRICSCTKSRVKRLEVSAEEPHLLIFVPEDGLVRQIDIREDHICGEDAKTLLINIKNHAGCLVQGSCLSLNKKFPEKLAVGCNDSFIRLYDRRMINVYTKRESELWSREFIASQYNALFNFTTDQKPYSDNLNADYVRYFTPGDFADHVTRKKRSANCTYITFSPNGKDLLANIGSDQLYLFDTTNEHNYTKYFTVPQTTTVDSNDPVTNADDKCLDSIFVTDLQLHKFVDIELPCSVAEIKTLANGYFNKTMYFLAILLYNAAINVCKNNAVLYSNRAAAYMQRNWPGDKYAALRDCHTAVRLDPNYDKPHFRLIRCLLDVGWIRESADCMIVFKKKFPNLANKISTLALTNDIEAKKDYAFRKNYPQFTTRAMLTSSFEKHWRKKPFDYEHRYTGHCNIATDIKEANFFGSKAEYILAGSDDGVMYMWDRESENLFRCVIADSSIVNCVQPHPHHPLIATSGIDFTVKLWTVQQPQVSYRDLTMGICKRVQNNNWKMVMGAHSFVYFGVENDSDSSADGSDV